MPRLPERTQLGTIQPRGEQSIVRGVQPIAEQATAQLGQTVAGVGLDLMERKAKLDYAKAKSEFLQEQALADHEISNSDDWAGYAENYQKRMTDARGRVLEKIPQAFRGQFEAESDVEIQRGILTMANRSLAKERDAGMASLVEAVQKNREAAITAPSEHSRAALLNDINERISYAKTAGHLGDNAETKAVQMRQQVSEDYATGYLSTLDPYSQLNALKNDKIVSEFIPADKRMALEERAKSDIASLEIRREKAEKLQLQQLHIDALNAVEQTGDLSGVPASTWVKLGASERTGLASYAKNIASGNYTATDWNAYYELANMAARPETRQQFLETDLATRFGDLAPAQRKQLIDMQADLREGADGSEFSSIVSDKAAADKALTALLGKKASKFSAEDAEFANAFYRVADYEMNAWLKENQGQKKVPPEVRDQIIDGLSMRSVDQRSLFGIDRLMPDVELSVIEEISADLEEAGQPVTAATIFKTYQRAKSAGIIK